MPEIETRKMMKIDENCQKFHDFQLFTKSENFTCDLGIVFDPFFSELHVFDTPQHPPIK
jgi:hypothetical protein